MYAYSIAAMQHTYIFSRLEAWLKEQGIKHAPMVHDVQRFFKILNIVYRLSKAIFQQQQQRTRKRNTNLDQILYQLMF